MIRSVAVPLIAVAAGCAQTGTGSSPQAIAEEQCFYLARAERFEYRGTGKVTQTGNGYNVEVRMRDPLDRPITAVCVYENGKTRWLPPGPPSTLRY